MCKTIDSEVILSYALSRSSSITIQKLRHIQLKILEELHDINVDVTRNSIRSAIEGNPHMFELRIGNNASITIKKSQKASSFFKGEHLDKCYASRFTKDEFESLKKIIIDSK
jgi:hypothetical protein